MPPIFSIDCWMREQLKLLLQLISPLVPNICICESGQFWFKLWFVAYSAPSHYLNQYWVIVNWTLRNKLHYDWLHAIFVCQCDHREISQIILDMFSAKFLWKSVIGNQLLTNDIVLIRQHYLTLYMLNFFKWNINIYLHFMSLLQIVWHRYLKSFFE